MLFVKYFIEKDVLKGANVQYCREIISLYYICGVSLLLIL